MKNKNSERIPLIPAVVGALVIFVHGFIVAQGVIDRGQGAAGGIGGK